MCLLTWVMGVLSSTSWFTYIYSFIYYFFVVVSRIGRKSTTKCSSPDSSVKWLGTAWKKELQFLAKRGLDFHQQVHTG
jgi:hypothetical protein